MLLNIGKISIQTFITVKGNYNAKKSVDAFFWKQSWNSDLDVIWFHIYRWYFCISYKNYFVKKTKYIKDKITGNIIGEYFDNGEPFFYNKELIEIMNKNKK